MFRVLWQIWEKLFSSLAHIETIAENGKPLMFRLALRKYRGKRLELPDGTALNPGDLIGELHFNNEMLRGISDSTDPARLAFSAKKAASRSLRALARWVQENPRYRDIKAIAGLSILHRGSQTMGFCFFDISPPLAFLVFRYESLLLKIFHPAGGSRFLKNKKKYKPKLLVMSKKELFSRYLEQESATIPQD